MTVTVADTTLFHLAALWLGDATLWDRIASFNGLSDPMIVGVTTLNVPPDGGSVDLLALIQS